MSEVIVAASLQLPLSSFGAYVMTVFAVERRRCLVDAPGCYEAKYMSWKN